MPDRENLGCDVAFVVVVLEGDDDDDNDDGEVFGVAPFLMGPLDGSCGYTRNLSAQKVSTGCSPL